MKPLSLVGYGLALLLYAGQALAELKVISAQTSLGPIEVSSLIQADLQTHGFSVRFVQPIDKGLKKYNKQQTYFRVIVFDPPGKDVPSGIAGDTLHAFIPLRIAVIKTDQGTQVNALPYADVSRGLPSDARVALQHWGEIVRDIIESLPG